MLVFLEVEVAKSFFSAASDAFGAGELGHQEAAVAEATDDAAEERIGDSGHGGEDGARADGEVAELVGLRNHGDVLSITGRLDGATASSLPGTT